MPEHLSIVTVCTSPSTITLHELQLTSSMPATTVSKTMDTLLHPSRVIALHLPLTVMVESRHL